nr:hypothetical protein [Burkholderia plantarii]
MNNTTQQAIVHQLREKILNAELSPDLRLVEISKDRLDLAPSHPRLDGRPS